MFIFSFLLSEGKFCFFIIFLVHINDTLQNDEYDCS